MKTIVVVSDTHGNYDFILKMYPLFQENDYIIHLGDGNRDMSDIYRAFPNKTFVCQGNCDAGTLFSRSEWELEIEGCKILCCHGHRYGVKSGTGELAKEAKERGFNVALYGHTHRARIEEIDGVTVMNPGNAKRYGTSPTYGYIVINGEKVTATLVPIYFS